VDVSDERLEAVRAELHRAGRPVLAEVVDICDPDACEAFVARVVERWGGVDVLVNNAGITHRSLFADTEPTVIRKVLEVNFFGAVNCTRAALPSLRERRGAIVALSSVAGFAPLIGRTGYAASKHALHGFFDTLRAELHGEVDVLVVCPAFTDTGLAQRAMRGDGSPVGRTRALAGRMLTPEEVAEAVVQAVRDHRRVLLLSPVTRMSWWVSRIWPRAYERLMRDNQRDEFPQVG